MASTYRPQTAAGAWLGVDTCVIPPSTTAPTGGRGRRSRSIPPGLSKLNHASDPVLGLHQLETAVDLVERDPVGDERVDVDFPLHEEVDELRHALAALDAAERRARDAATGDQPARDHVEGLALARHACDRAQAPCHPRRLD